MAETNQIIYELEIKGTEQELDNLERLNRNMRTLKSEIKELKDVDSKAAEKKKIQLKGESEEYRKLQTQLKNRSKAQKDEVKTLESMRAKLRDFNRQLEKTEVGTKKFKELTSQSKKLRDEIKGADEETGRFQGNVGNYKGAILDAFSQMGVNVRGVTTAMQGLGGATKTTTAGVNTLSGAFKILKFAIASTGIGLFIIAIASLVTYFQSTEEGAAKLQKILSPFKILFGNLKDKLADFGEVLIGAFENPKQAIADLWEAIKQNFLNRVQGVIKVAKGLGTVLEGVWELDTDKINAGFEDAGKAMLDVMTGVEDFAEKGQNVIGNFIKEVATETRAENEKNIEVINRQLALDKKRRAFKVDEAKIETEISEQRLIANDRLKTAEERQLAINAAIELNKKLAADRKAIEEEDLALMELRASFSDSDAETLNEIADKKAQIVRLDKQQADSARMMVSMRGTINAQLEKERDLKYDIDEIDQEDIEEMDAEEAADQKKFREKEKIQQMITDSQFTELQKRERQYKDWLEKDYITFKQYAELKEKLDKEKTRGKLQLASQALGQLAQFAGEETKLGKAAAIAQATINTFLGVSQSLSSYPMPIAGIFAALSLASGLATVQKIVSTKDNVKAPRFARGVIGLNGAGSETSDSIDAKLSRGESVMTAKATKAYAPVLAEMEMSVGNKPNFSMGNRKFASGFIPKTDYQSASEKIISQTVEAIGDIPVVVSETDITSTQNKVRTIEVTGDL